MDILIQLTDGKVTYLANDKVADIIVANGTEPYTYTLATGSDYFQIAGTEVQVKANMTLDNVQTFSVTATDSTSDSVTSDVITPNLVKSSQSLFNKANQIYKITKDIDLGGETLTIPANCTLDFQGGSFSNGTIQGNNTKIENATYKIFSSVITGTWSLDCVYPEWFGAKGDGTTDDSQAIQLAINFIGSYEGTLKLKSQRTYLINTPVVFWGTKFVIDGSYSKIIKKSNTTTGITEEYTLAGGGTCSLNVNAIFVSRAAIQEMEIKNIKISNSGTTGYCFYFPEFSKSKIEKVYAYNSNYFFSSYDCWEVMFYNITGYNLSQALIDLRKTGTSISCINCYLGNDAQQGQAFKIVGIAYSSFINCAGDLCYNVFNFDNTKAVIIGGGIEGTAQYGFLIQNNSIVEIINGQAYEVFPTKETPMLLATKNSKVTLRNSAFTITAYNVFCAATDNSIINIEEGVRVSKDGEVQEIENWNLQTGSESCINIKSDKYYYQISNAGITAVKNRYAMIYPVGNTASRPSNLSQYDQGLQYYDIQLKKYICWNGTDWVNMDGTALE